MAEATTRVALLARPGAACDGLQAALRQAGADVVAVFDPGHDDPATLAATDAGAVLVALEPAVEDALERYDAVLSAPGRLVIYEDAAVAARREGWDAARWSRHLAAKLGGHGDVLPPGADPDEAPPRDAADDVHDAGFDEMSLVDIEPEAKGHGEPRARGGEGGAVVVLAGIGGPDAVRQFLAALPAGFSRPIVVRQRLDGGRHDRLVRQMQRATALPVELAEAGRELASGHVYILPDAMATTAGEGATRFVAAAQAPVPVLAGLPAGDSAVFVLSGSDPALVPELMQAARDGALVAGQLPEDSFDGVAAEALLAAGGECATAPELAQRLGTRWLSLED